MSFPTVYYITQVIPHCYSAGYAMCVCVSFYLMTHVPNCSVLLSKMNKTTCMFDPFPTRLLLDFSHLFIDVIVRIINLTFSTASFPVAFKSAVVKPLLKNLHLTAIF